MTTKLKIPKIRFKEFSSEWEEKEFWNFVNKEKWKYNPKTSSENLTCIELESIEQNTWGLLNTFDSKKQESIKNIFKQWNVLYSKLRPYLNKYYYAKFDWVCSSEIWVLNWLKTDNNFLYYIIQTSKFSKVANISFGSKMPRSDWDFVSWTPFWIPSLPEQQKIASFLSSVDEKIEKIKEKKKNLEEYKKWVMQKIFSQEMRFKDENWDEFGEWGEKKLGEIFDIKAWNSKSSYIDENWKNIIVDMWAIWSNYNLIWNKKTNHFEDLLTINDLVMAKDDIWWWNIVWKVVLINKNNKYILWDHVYKLTLKNWIIKFLYYSINSYKINKSFRQKANWTAQIWITNWTVLNQIIPFPTLKEQEKIADFLSGIDEKIEKVNDELEKLEDFKKGLLQGMFV